MEPKQGTRLPNEQYTVRWIGGGDWTIGAAMVMLDELHYKWNHEENTPNPHGIKVFVLGRIGRSNVVVFQISSDAMESETLAMKAADKMESDFVSIRYTFTLTTPSCRRNWRDMETTDFNDVMICCRGIFRYRCEEYGFATHNVTMPPEDLLRAAQHIRSKTEVMRNSELEKILASSMVPRDKYYAPAIHFGKVVTNSPSNPRGPNPDSWMECNEDLGNAIYPQLGMAALVDRFPGLAISGIADFNSQIRGGFLAEPDARTLRNDLIAAHHTAAVARYIVYYNEIGEDINPNPKGGILGNIGALIGTIG
ncbi:MAG: hypothetical protein M1840_002180 [Geoglossum simile]|nr:MAG: hypothetical protein M1840_002180 [Geoglossum simile]